MNSLDHKTKSSIIKLNIGGVRYTTTRTTLLARSESNFFTHLLSGEFPATLDEKGYYFIDRDGDYFKPILEYLRVGEFNVPPGMSRKAVAREANFFQIDIPFLSFGSISSTHSPPKSPRTDGLYISSAPSSDFYIFGKDGKGFSSRDGEFRWELKHPLLQLAYPSKDQVTYKEGVIYKQRKTSLLWDDGAVYDISGERMEFYEAGEWLTGVPYAFSDIPITISIGEQITHILFNSMPQGNSEGNDNNQVDEKTVSLLWKSNGANWISCSFEDTNFCDLDALSISFLWTSAKLELICFRNFLVARKCSVRNATGVSPFSRFAIVTKTE